MGKVANDRVAAGPVLPTQPGDAAAVRGSTSRQLGHGLPLREVLEASSLRGARLAAGAGGLDRVVSRLNVMEVPDILPWVKPHELLLTTGYPLRDAPEALAELVVQLDARRLAGIAVKLGRYLDELPAAMVAAADRLGFPIIRLPDDVAFDDILNAVLTDILNRQAGLLARSEEVHRALVQIVLGGGGVQEVSDELAGILGGAVFVTTPDGRVLAASGDAAIRERALRAERFAAAGRFRTEFWADGVRATGDGPPQRAVVPVVAGSLDHGRIVAFADDRALGDLDVSALERAATVCALAITKDLAVGAVEAKYRGDFLRDLLTGRTGAGQSCVAHCASLGWDLDRPTVVVVAELDPVPPAPGPLAGPARRPVQERFAAAWAGVVAARDPHAPVAGFSREVVTVLGVPPGRDVDRMVRELVAGVSGDGGGGRQPFSTGVSRLAPDVSAVSRAYEQARTAVRVGRQVHGGGGVAYFDSLGVFRVLSLVNDPEELRSFAAEVLGELATCEDAGTADLRQTLQVLLDHNLNVAETARSLHFHYNTLRYRIAKLEGMLGPFSDDAQLRLNVMLALQVLRMRGLD
jgi:purine catabolism regulator